MIEEKQPNEPNDAIRDFDIARLLIARAYPNFTDEQVLARAMEVSGATGEARNLRPDDPSLSETRGQESRPDEVE